MIRRFVTMTESVDVKAGIKNIVERIEIASRKRPEKFKNPVQLVAVGKTKPVEALIDAYDAGQRHFGENYVKELAEKAIDPKILENCKDIKWHFIGHLQTNKINKVIKLPGLYMIQTIDSEKLAEAVNNAWEKNRLESDGKLKVLIQVNTSAEDAKNGVDPDKVPELFEFINDKCKALKLEGLMTIGAFGYDYTKGPNPDFTALMECLNHLPNPESLQVSFGMSNDFEEAIQVGSTIVRVGSSIFGFRPKKL
ncbi:CLUMA_CG002539, isoform A [Clunio marinus]|uniref:Pyridoxal phosphate homeostasis protein n=1 Tax=Clunio marinus TaxID=568069 RepID=A0A1J1HRK7_9DIPT|nr:CLUMA_CG002539, isoform A [Clunio marinus]